MDAWILLGFLLIVLLGSYVQAVAGFAMGMIIVAVVGGLNWIDLPTLAAVVSLLSILNVVLALRGQTHRVHRALFVWLAAGQLPAIWLGFQLLLWLDGNAQSALKLILGVFITVGGVSLAIRPQPWSQVSAAPTTWLVGVCGGLVGGMFSASGPVLGWFGYSQPLPVLVVRATLLACFALTTATRTVFVGLDGGLTPRVLGYIAVALPVVVLGTWLGSRFGPLVTEQNIRRMAYGLLLLMGSWITISALWRVVSP